MATNILMPALCPTMTEGTLARWLKKEGEQVRAGDIIAEIETDKATMEVEAVDEGVLGHILVPDGTANVKVNDPIAVLVEEGESAPDAAATPKAAAPAAPPPQRRRPNPRRPPLRRRSRPPRAARHSRPPPHHPHLRRCRTGMTRAGFSRRRWRGAWPSRPGSTYRR